MEAIAFILFVLIVGLGPVVLIRRTARIRPAEQTDDPQRAVEPFDTDNPYLQAVFQSPMFRKVPHNVGALMRKITPDPDEEVFAALPTNHGKWQRGYLLLTTEYVRWVRTFPGTAEEWWPYTFDLERVVGKVLAIGGLQFQPLRHAKEFQSLFRNLQHGLLYEEKRGPAQRDGAVDSHQGHNAVSAEEIERLVQLRDSGAITDEEFQQAKAKLLG